jgi:hypothetical protein
VPVGSPFAHHALSKPAWIKGLQNDLPLCQQAVDRYVTRPNPLEGAAPPQLGLRRFGSQGGYHHVTPATPAPSRIVCLLAATKTVQRCRRLAAWESLAALELHKCEL